VEAVEEAAVRTKARQGDVMKPTGEEITRACFKEMHELCSGVATFGWEPSQPCHCSCHVKEGNGKEEKCDG